MSEYSWWENIVFCQRRQLHSYCPTCDSPVDSLDVVCQADHTILLGSGYSKQTKVAVLGGLRTLFVGAALAVGYLGWSWPIYVLSLIHI